MVLLSPAGVPGRVRHHFREEREDRRPQPCLDLVCPRHVATAGDNRQPVLRGRDTEMVQVARCERSEKRVDSCIAIAMHVKERHSSGRGDGRGCICAVQKERPEAAGDANCCSNLGREVGVA